VVANALSPLGVAVTTALCGAGWHVTAIVVVSKCDNSSRVYVLILIVVVVVVVVVFLMICCCSVATEEFDSFVWRLRGSGARVLLVDDDQFANSAQSQVLVCNYPQCWSINTLTT
jgi:hypothetical protein